MRNNVLARNTKELAG